MPDETPRPPDPATRRIVKKTVAKPVVRPAAAASKSAESAPPPTPRAKAAVATRPTPSAKDRLVGRSRPRRDESSTEQQRPVRQRRPRPTIDLGAVAGSFGERVRTGAGRTRTGVSGTARRGGTWVRDRYDDVILWSMPHQPPLRAAVITGLVVGLLVTLLGWLSLVLFSEVRGVSSGGGVWGSLAVLVIAAVAAFAGTRLLRSMGTAHAVGITAIGLMTAVVLILALFLDAASGGWAWIVVPGVSLAGFVVGERLMSLSTVEVPSD